jgi:hypothetical protein
MQQRLEEFVTKSATERLKSLFSTRHLWLIIGSNVAMIVAGIAYAMWVHEQRLQTEVFLDLLEQARREIKVVDTVRSVLPHLEAALDELGKQDTDKAKVVVSIRGAVDALDSSIRNLGGRRSALPEWDFFSIASAHAQAQPSAPAPGATPPTLPSDRALTPEAKRWLLGGVLGILGIVFIVSVSSIFMTKDADVLRFAFDTVKTLMGFFIGVATSLIA